ncbi:MAG: hypothetical protein ACRCTY_04650 [Candidatus Adiutrix sp.]
MTTQPEHEPKFAPKPKRAYVIGTLILSALLILALVFFTNPNNNPQEAQPALAPVFGETDATLESFQNMWDAPLGTAPAAILKTVEETIGKVEDRQNPDFILD